MQNAYCTAHRQRTQGYWILMRCELRVWHMAVLGLCWIVYTWFHRAISCSSTTICWQTYAKIKEWRTKRDFTQSKCIAFPWVLHIKYSQYSRNDLVLRRILLKVESFALNGFFNSFYKKCKRAWMVGK